jgi:hypothetical protein
MFCSNVSGDHAQPPLLYLCLSLAVARAHGQAVNPKPATSDDFVPIDVSALTPPIAFKAAGRWNLACEVRIASLADKGDTTLTGM